MISRNDRLSAFIELGKWLQTKEATSVLEEWAEDTHHGNPWFTPANTTKAIRNIGLGYLEEKALKEWSNAYNEPLEHKKIGLVMAGNIPAAGFQDALCVLISGHKLLAKLSKSDGVLLKHLLTKLISFDSRFDTHIQWMDKLNEADAYIATGSDNTARYFEYYFSNKPHIIRKNRVSVAVLTGKESKEELIRLGHDILDYYGFGCRNVSKLYVPEGYDWSLFFDALEEFRRYCITHHKYFNNYEYNRSVLLLNGTPHLENGFLIVLESDALVSPISVVHFAQYRFLHEVIDAIQGQTGKIQCVVGNQPDSLKLIPFGQSQQPGLKDYPDGVDVMAFLETL